jgi:hypothetical protein
MPEPTPKQAADWRAFLLAVPVRNHAAEEGEERDGVLPVTVRVEPPRWCVPPLTWVLPLRTRRTVKLDPLGVVVWRSCDGKATVENLVDALAARERLTFHEARLTLGSFLQDLVRRGVIALVLPKP